MHRPGLALRCSHLQLRAVYLVVRYVRHYKLVVGLRIPSTTRRYESIWYVHIQKTIETHSIASLGTYEIEQYFRKMKEAGLAEATVRRTRAISNRGCLLARKLSSGTHTNPVADSEIPTWPLGDSHGVIPPRREEVKALIQAATKMDIRFAVLLRVVLATGMRRGEDCGLQRNDIDFANRVIRINKSVVAAAGAAVIKSPEARSSIRNAPIGVGTQQALKDLFEAQRDLAQLTMTTHSESCFVLSFTPGGLTPQYPDSASHVCILFRMLVQVGRDNGR